MKIPLIDQNLKSINDNTHIANSIDLPPLHDPAIEWIADKSRMKLFAGSQITEIDKLIKQYDYAHPPEANNGCIIKLRTAYPETKYIP